MPCLQCNRLPRPVSLRQAARLLNKKKMQDSNTFEDILFKD